MKKTNLLKLTVLSSIVIFFATWKFNYQFFSFKLFQLAIDKGASLLFVKGVHIFGNPEAKEIGGKKAPTRSQVKMIYFLAQTITHLTRTAAYADKLKGPTAEKLAKMPTGFAPVCFGHFHMTPDNQGGVYAVGEWKANILSHPEALQSHSLIHYKSDGSSANILKLDEMSGVRLIASFGMGLDSNNNLYIGGAYASREGRIQEKSMLVVRIVDFPNIKKFQPYVGTTSDFPINLLDFCSEIPELCKGEKKLSYAELTHLSMDAKDNLYLGFKSPNPSLSKEGYLQITLVKIEPSKKVACVGSFPICRIDPKTHQCIAEHNLGYYEFGIPMIDIDFSLAVDRSGNIFIHNRNVLFQFESTPYGYSPVKIVQRMKDFSNQRTITSSPEGSIFTLRKEEKAIWKMLPDFSWEFVLDLPHDSDDKLRPEQQPYFESIQEIAFDRAERLFIFDSGKDAITVYK
jgi:hypothetical protein